MSLTTLMLMYRTLPRMGIQYSVQRTACSVVHMIPPSSPLYSASSQLRISVIRFNQLANTNAKYLVSAT